MLSRARERPSTFVTRPRVGAMMNDLSQLVDIQALLTRLIEYLPRLAAAALILGVFWLGFRIVRRLLEPALIRMEIQEALRDLLIDKFLRYALVLVAVVMAADQLGISVGAALAGLGVAGIALGFAAQDSVANVISGILIFLDKPFDVGDWIETEGQYGKVSEITLRSTRIRTTRNTFVVIPNKRIIDATLENYSKHGVMRIDIPIGIAFKENVSEARKVLLDSILPMDGLCFEPAPDVTVVALGDSAVNLTVRVWIDDGEYRHPVYSCILEGSKVALDRAGIQIPFPHLQLFVENVDDRVWKGMSSVSGVGG